MVIVDANNVNGLPLGQSRGVVADVQHLPAHHMVDLRQHLSEGAVDVGGVEGRGLHEERAVLLSEGLPFLRRNGPDLPQVRLVAHKHDDDVRVSVVAQLPQPLLGVLEGDAASHVVDEERAGGASIVRACDCSVPGLMNETGVIESIVTAGRR